MSCPRVPLRQSGCCRTKRAACALVLIAIASVWSRAQASGTADLSGCIRDSAGHPLAAARVTLQTAAGARDLAGKTDSQGTYHFPGLTAGAYKLGVQVKGYSPSMSTITVTAGETKTLDLTLASEREVSSQAPEFYDEPQFTVAGVTDTTNLGTHGADTVARTTESLVRDTASLSKTPKGSSPDPSAAPTERSLREAAQREPRSFAANYRLGKMLLDAGRAKEAAPYLELATQVNPRDDQAAYDLATACADIGEYEHARSTLQALLTRQDNPEAHHLLGDVDEKLSKPVEAANEYQRAAELVASESNLFSWGAELLMHRAFEPAGEVFTKGNRGFPSSARMLVGLGVSLYARGSYDQAVRRLCEASDLDPSSPTAYLFLGKIQTIEKAGSQEVTDKLARFLRLQPESALANYYYAASLWKARSGPEDKERIPQIESLLKTAVQLDPKLGPAFLQLGILYEEGGRLPLALSAYQQAAAASPQLDQAHYRLAQAYRKSGDAQKAKTELELYRATSKEAVEEAEREQREIQGFVYTLRDRTPIPQAQQKPPAPQ
jgi:tetratricopeptide (TPR) repeat protein